MLFFELCLLQHLQYWLSKLQQLPWWGFLEDWQNNNPHYFPVTRCCTLIRPLPSSFLFMYNLATLLFGCILHTLSLFSLISCLDLSIHSGSFNSLFTLYLNTATAYAFIAVILFFLFSFYFRIYWSLHLYFFIAFSIILFSLILCNLTVPKCVSFLFNPLHYFTVWEFYSFTSNYFSLHGKNSSFFSYQTRSQYQYKRHEQFSQVYVFVLYSWKTASNHWWTTNETKVPYSKQTTEAKGCLP